MWLSRDPAGFVDGPNVYAYVKQNPWTSFDPLGLADAPANRPPNLLEFFHPDYLDDAIIEKQLVAVAKANPTKLVFGMHGTPDSFFDSNTGKNRYERWAANQIKSHPFYPKADGIICTACRTGNIQLSEGKFPIAARTAKVLGEKEFEAPVEYGYTDLSGKWGSVPAKNGATEKGKLGDLQGDFSKEGHTNVFDKNGKLVRTNTIPPLRPESSSKDNTEKDSPKTSFWGKVKDLFKGKKS